MKCLDQYILDTSPRLLEVFCSDVFAKSLLEKGGLAFQSCHFYLILDYKQADDSVYIPTYARVIFTKA